jgi:hypothetical protein
VVLFPFNANCVFPTIEAWRPVATVSDWITRVLDGVLAAPKLVGRYTPDFVLQFVDKAVECVNLGCLGAPASKLTESVVPAWARIWIDAFLSYPKISVVLLALLSWLFFRKNDMLQAKIAARAELAWANGALPVPDDLASTLTDRIARAVRTSRPAVRIYRFIALDLLPFLFAWTIGLAIFAIVMIKLAWRGIRRHGLAS